MPRPYNKSSAYWENRKVAASKQLQPITINTAPTTTQSSNIRAVPFPDIEFGSTQISTASAVPSAAVSSRWGQTNIPGRDPEAYQNLKQMPLSFAGYGDNRNYTGIRDAVELCMRAWVGFSAFRNAVEVAVEFSDQPLVWKFGGNQAMQTFFEEWFKAVKGEQLKRESLREYWRSGNVFLYKFMGKFGPTYYKNFQQSFGAKDNKIPIRYYLINPSNVFVPTGLTFPYTYVRLLSTYDIERLRNPMTPQDKQVYDDLPQFVKDQIKVTAAYPLGIYIPMEPERLRFMFYKKQSYEPLSTPMGYPVMADIEWKLSLKKMDMQLARTIEHAILLVTTGETGTQYNGGNGINPNNIARLQNLLINQTVGRVLVADFTTKAQWLIPDIDKILGPSKYQIVNEDIAEGLQSIFVGKDSKFANAQVKAKIFIKRLEESQKIFLNDFLIPEIVTICDAMGFRSIPEVTFQKIDLDDDTVMARVYAQLGQLGILTADQVINAMETGVLPDKEEMDSAQTEYTKKREKGLYLPLVGASMQDGQTPGQGGNGPNGRPAGSTGIKQTTKKVSPIGTSRGSTAFSIKAYKEHLLASQDLTDEIESSFKKRFKIKSLNEVQEGVVTSIAKIIMATHPIDKWSESVASTIEKPNLIPASVADEIDQICTDYNVDVFDATILRRCKTAAVSE